jgi:5'-nucleotidase
MPYPKTLSFALLSVSLLALGFGPAPQNEDAPPLRILVTNDDGIESPGVSALVTEFAKFADVWVSAPDGNRSGSSASSDGFGRPLTLVEHEIEGAQRACAIGGKPVDAAQFGIFSMGPAAKDSPKRFDLVVSGINHGANVGELAHYSGTVGAAVAAAHSGIPAIAVSQERSLEDFGFTARFTARFARELLGRSPRGGVIYSINVPAGSADEIRGVAPAFMGGAVFGIDGYAEGEDKDGNSVCRARMRRYTEGPVGSDTAQFLARNITITPLRFDWTDRDALEELKGWDLGVE